MTKKPNQKKVPCSKSIISTCIHKPTIRHFFRKLPVVVCVHDNFANYCSLHKPNVLLEPFGRCSHPCGHGYRRRVCSLRGILRTDRQRYQRRTRKELEVESRRPPARSMLSINLPCESCFHCKHMIVIAHFAGLPITHAQYINSSNTCLFHSWQLFFCVLAFRLVPALPMGDMPQVNMAASVLIPATSLAIFVRSNE